MRKNISTLIASWNKQHGPEYQVREQEILWNLSLTGPYRYSIETVGDVRVLLARSADGLWVSLWSELGDDGAFVQSLKDLARREKKTSVGIGGDEFHFVPGVPMSSDAGQRLARQLEAAGFTGRTVVDLVGGLNRPAVARFIAEATQTASQKKWHLTEIQGADDREDLSQFMLSEFPGRWSREWEFWRSQMSTPCADYFILRAADRQILGFVRLSSYATHSEAWVPGNIRLPPHQQGLGPIGVGKSLRGQGAGKALLGLALAKARERLTISGENLCIDWTDVPSFYQPLGFEEVRTYRVLRLKLS